MLMMKMADESRWGVDKTEEGALLRIDMEQENWSNDISPQRRKKKAMMAASQRDPAMTKAIMKGNLDL